MLRTFCWAVMITKGKSFLGKKRRAPPSAIQFAESCRMLLGVSLTLPRVTFLSSPYNTNEISWREDRSTLA